RERPTRASMRSYAVAVLAPAVARGIARGPIVHLESAPVSLFLCAVMLSAWLGGVGPGLLATVLSAAAFAYYFVNPFEMPRFVVFVLAAVLVGSLSAAQRRSMHSLRKAEETLRETQAALAHVTRVMAIREVVALSQGEARKHDAALRTQLPDDLPPVRGDRVQLQQVVLNLIMNGLEAMSAVHDRPRELVIRTQTGEALQVRVTVRDSG